jgi:hypothetical protein
MLTRRAWLVQAGLSLGVTSGCGTILYPERRGQPAGRLDWGIVALDAVGLLFFFVPGVIAFAVDFNNGTIYLPPEHYGSQPESNRQLSSHRIDGDPHSVRDVERAVSQHAGRPVELQPGGYETRPLESLDDFWATQAALATR